MNVNVTLIAASYYLLYSLGFLVILVSVSWLWYRGLNYFYKSIKATYRFVEFIQHRKEFLHWLKDKSHR